MSSDTEKPVDNPFLNSNILENLQELLQHEPNRAKEFLNKLKTLSQTFETLSDDEKKNVYEKFDKEFKYSIKNLRNKLLNEKYNAQEYEQFFPFETNTFWTVLSFFVVILAIGKKKKNRQISNFIFL